MNQTSTRKRHVLSHSGRLKPIVGVWILFLTTTTCIPMKKMKHWRMRQKDPEEIAELFSEDERGVEQGSTA
ncbi:hypothetical protein JTB14_005311 [Gonioctena quinquepunctata]|nr:hypothetical protein JTB14_005311 [Gonioctena quinquepunctata]